MGLVPGGPYHKTFLCPELIPEDSELVYVCHFHPSLIFAGECGASSECYTHYWIALNHPWKY